MSTKHLELSVIAGIDTHKETHTAAVLDEQGRYLDHQTFPTTSAGHRALLRWLLSFGRVARIGVEGTGSYGVGLTRFLHSQRLDVLEVSRPNRQARRRRGKSDPADAEAAARAVLADQCLGLPKEKTGNVEIIRMLRVQRRSAIKARTQAANQLRAIVDTAPDNIREGLRGLTLRKTIARAAGFRKTSLGELTSATRCVLRGIACRWRLLDQEVTALDMQLTALVASTAPELVALTGVGTDVAGALLVAAGDNPERITHERSFAALCGVSPVDASSGKQRRHRLNRGGDRDANRALWVVVLVRMRRDPRTKAYFERRTQQGLSKAEIFRCLKRYVAREIFRILRELGPRLKLDAPLQFVA